MKRPDAAPERRGTRGQKARASTPCSMALSRPGKRAVGKVQARVLAMERPGDDSGMLQRRLGVEAGTQLVLGPE